MQNALKDHCTTLAILAALFELLYDALMEGVAEVLHSIPVILQHHRRCVVRQLTLGLRVTGRGKATFRPT